MLPPYEWRDDEYYHELQKQSPEKAHAYLAAWNAQDNLWWAAYNRQQREGRA